MVPSWRWRCGNVSRDKIESPPPNRDFVVRIHGCTPTPSCFIYLITAYKSGPFSCQSQRDFIIQPKGCRVGEATLGKICEWNPTLKGLQHPASRGRGKRCNPFRVDDVRAAPRVARASQPWAGGWNPFGIRGGTGDLCAMVSQLTERAEPLLQSTTWRGARPTARVRMAW